MPIVTEVAVLPDDAQGGCDGAANVVVVYWNTVELQELTDLVITPMDDIDMAEMLGIPVDDKDKEKKKGETNVTAGSEDVDPELMKEAADDVDDNNDDEMVNVYDRDNPVIEVGKFFSNHGWVYDVF